MHVSPCTNKLLDASMGDKLIDHKMTQMKMINLVPQMDRRGGEGGGRDGHGDRIHLNSRTRPQRKEKGKSNCCK